MAGRNRSMKRTHSLRHTILGLFIAIIGAIGIAITAWAFFTSTGSGTASATAGTLSAPTITGATPGAGTVAISWSTVSPPTGSTTVKYYVTRDSGSAGGNCPVSGSPTTVTSCTDSGLSSGSHSYAVTAVWQSWTATSTTSNVNLTSGAATHLVFTTQPSGGVNGAAFTTQPVVKVEDSGGNVVTIPRRRSPWHRQRRHPDVVHHQPGLPPPRAWLTFAGCRSPARRANFTLSAVTSAADGLRPPGNFFALTVGAATQLVFTTQPAGRPTAWPSPPSRWSPSRTPAATW